MMRTTTTLLATLLMSLVSPLVSPGGGPALACDQPERVAAAAAAAATEAAPPAPRAPRARRPVAPAAPGEASAPSPVAAPAPPDAGFEIPGAPSLVTPRGWFGFGFQCGDCSVQTVAADSGAIWEFGTWPRVYSVDLGSPAARAGLRRGDVITQIDGISILAPEGGRRFGAIRPGQSVRWTLLRDGSLRHVIARAAERPERRERVALTDLRRELVRLNELSDLTQLRKELATLNRQMERVKLQDLQRVRVRTLPVRRLRYAGVIGGTEVEVRGPGSVIVSENDDKGELVITTGESVVVIRVPESMRKTSGDKPK